MAAHARSPQQSSARSQVYPAQERYGWMLLASIVLMLLGTIDLIEGLAAVGGSQFFVRGSHYIAGNLTAWGWVVTVIGTAEFVIGLGVLMRVQLARWAGVVVLSADVIVQLLLMPAAPFLSLAIIGLDIVAIYALTVHGGEVAAG
jgi:hypothetical protein